MPSPRLHRRQLFAAGLSGALAGCDLWKDPLDTAHITGGFAGVSSERGHRLREPLEAQAPAATHRTRVLILGGGVAGLAAARALRLRSMDDFALLELEDSAGGNARGMQVQGIACPIGAHYLPVPGDSAPDVQDFLEELGLRRRVAGRWQYDERHLCHSPQERLFFQGAWQDGLLPVQDVGPETLAQYRRFSALVEETRRTGSWSIPRKKVPLTPAERALTAITLGVFLDGNGLNDPHLRWYLDYCCRDDYGAGLATVSAWAGMHYFASRHGFRAPGAGATESSSDSGVLTWPQGNGWLTHRMAATLGQRLNTGRIVLGVTQDRRAVQVDTYHVATQRTERWLAEHAIVALPIFVAARVVRNPPGFLEAAARQVHYAPWLVTNLHLAGSLQGARGAAPSWDNVIYGEGPTQGGLGYVNAQHQSLHPVPGATVLTYYRAMGGGADGGAQARRSLMERPWSHWRDAVVQELSVAHPDLAAKVTQIEVTRYGHAMAIPLPDVQGRVGFASAVDGRLRYAHSDWAGYSVFEEAFCGGHAAGDALAQSLRLRSST